jgi:hypothetical protein
MQNVNKEALDLAARMLELDLPDEARKAIERVTFKMQLPMPVILSKVAGESVTAKCRTLGIARWTWYRWHDHGVRPKRTQATRLSELTGFDVEAILGFDGRLPRRAKKPRLGASATPAAA